MGFGEFHTGRVHGGFGRIQAGLCGGHAVLRAKTLFGELFGRFIIDAGGVSIGFSLFQACRARFDIQPAQQCAFFDKAAFADGSGDDCAGCAGLDGNGLVRRCAPLGFDANGVEF